MHRVVGALLAVLSTCLVVASATSLGTFDDVVLDGAAAPVDLCTGEPTLLDDLLLPVVLPTDVTTLLGGVEVTSLGGDCTGTQATLVVIGTSLSDPTQRVLEVVDLGDPLAGTGDLFVAPYPGSIDLTLMTITDVRVVFPSAP